jgi:hypothetical protein
MKCWMCIGVLSVLGLGGATWAGIGVGMPAAAALEPGQCLVTCTDAAGNVKECVLTCNPDCPPDCQPGCLPDCTKSACEASCAPAEGACVPANGACAQGVDQVADAPAR